MEKLIDAEVVKEYLKRAIWGADPKIDGWVDAMPAADAVPVVHGRWEQPFINRENGSASHDFRCSACRRYRFHNGEMCRKYKYCPNCGAKMDSE